MNRVIQVNLARLAFIAPSGGKLRPILHRMRGVKVGDGTWISQQVYLDELYPESISIGRHCTIGYRSSIFCHFHWGKRRPEGGSNPVIIEDDVFIGPHCVILPGVRVGAGSVIQAGSTISKNVPSGLFWASAGGHAVARATTPLTPEHSYEEFIRGLRLIERPARREDRPPIRGPND